MSTDPPPEPEPDDSDNRIFFPGPPGSHHCAHWPLRPPDPQPELGEADQFVEVDPTGRYGRYRDVLGKGAFKKVYKAFDELEGIEVAWNQVRVADVLRNSEDMDRLYSEVHLLKTLKHKNIIKFYNSWVDKKRDNSINFITEVFTSGTLSQYRRKHKHVDIRALKNWSRQILSGLQYLHSHDPPVIHRDLKCDNIFVNGNQGEVKIGDLGLAAILRHAHIAHSVIVGTPEFMAPELYEEEYNELVDIYAFGMCLLELVTFEYPYSECSTPAQIYKKVMSGVKPASLSKVTDPAVKEFIEKCISNASERLSARALLRDPFLEVESRNGSVGHHSDLNLQDNLGCSDPSTGNLFNTETCMNGCPDASTNNLYSTDTCMNGLDFTVEGQRKDSTDTCMNGRDFTVEGQRKDINTIFLKLRIADLSGQFRNIHFPFDIEADTSISVATEMVSELDLTDQDVTAIAEMIDAEIQAHVPEWVRAFEDDHGNEITAQVNDDIKAADELSSLRNESNPLAGGLVLEQLSSGRKYWSDSPRGTSIGSPRLAHSHLSSELNSHGVDGFSVDFCEKAENLPDGEDHDVSSSHGTSSSNPRESPHFIDCANDNFEVTLSEPLKFRCETFEAIVDHNQSDLCCPRSGDRQRGNEDNPNYSEKELLGNNSESFKYVTKKLKHLLVEQQKELDSLRKKHDMSISDVLKELPPELCRTILSMFGLKVPDYVVHSELEVHSGPSTTYSTPDVLRSHCE